MRLQYHPNRIDGSGGFHEVINLSDVVFEHLNECPVCGGKQLCDVVVLKDSLTSTICSSCGHFFQRRRPCQPWMKQWYRNNWDWRREMALAKIWKRARFVASGFKNRFAIQSVFNFVKEILPNDRKSFRVLEIGCGYGNQLIPFRLAGIKVCAIEASTHRAQFARKLLIDVRNQEIESLEKEMFGEKFDLIFSHHVLEHVTSPQAFMTSVTKLLKPGGWLALFVPNLENESLLWSAFSVLHLQVFSPTSLRHLLHSYGLEINRWGEDHELSVLARQEAAPSLSFAHKDCTISKERIFLNMLGPHYENRRDRTYFCRWKSPKPRIRSIRAMEYGDEPDPKAPSEIQLRWGETMDLPISIDKNGQSAPFWIK